jgi:hypothetical protein
VSDNYVNPAEGSAETTRAEDASGGAKERLSEAREWLDKIQAREKFFESGWWKAAENAVTIYSSEKDTEQLEPYNILYSNTEVIKPSLYSATPKPDVRSRFKEIDLGPVPIAAERFLTVLSDPSNPGEESLDDAMSETTLSSLVPGMGFIRLRYYDNRPIPLCFESGHYKGLIWGPARKWAKVPWVAFRHELTKQELFDQFQIPGEDEDNYVAGPGEEGEGKSASPKGTIVYELWVKAEKKVYFLCEDWKELELKSEDDVLGLEGFFPTPGPLLLTRKPGKIVPIPLYQYYRNQAEELNRVTVRLNKVLSAIKVRGAYNLLLGTEMEHILSSDDSENKLFPAKESMMLAQNGGFERQIWMLPIEKLVQVATELYQARQQIKAVIYELTGISDILRGSSVASETATAQDLKNKWGTIRLRDMQKAVADYVRDLYRLALDCGAKRVPPAQWNAMIQMGLPTEQEKAAAAATVQHLMMLGSQMQAQGVPPPPEGLKQLQQAQATASKPSIESVVKQIASDANRTYTINVQSNSTVDLDTATDKQEVGEFMNAMGQLMAGLAPLVQLGPTGLAAAKSILVAVCQRFKFGLAIVDSIMAVQQPPPAQTGPTPEQEKKDQDLKQQQAQLEQTQSKLKDQLTAIQDEQRNLETAKKEFDAEVRVVRAELDAQKAIMTAQDQAKAASEQAKQAQNEATFTKQKMELTSAATGAKVAQKSQQQAAAQTAPLMQGVTQALAALQAAMDKMTESANAPREVIKTPTGFKSVVSK